MPAETNHSQSAVLLEKLSSALLSHNEKLDARFRALFTLKGLATKHDDLMVPVIDIISKGFADDSALLKHELAYVLGQLADERAVPVLEDLVERMEAQPPIVRHEAAEGLGAISTTKALPLLRRHAEDPNEDVHVRQTCELAIAKIEWDHTDQGARLVKEKAEKTKLAVRGQGEEHEAFAPIDPAPAFVREGSSSIRALAPEDYDIPALCDTLKDEQTDLFARYRAMFSLRNAVHSCLRASEALAGRSPAQAEALQAKSDEAILALAAGLLRPAPGQERPGGALFRHEICFVFGELCHTASTPALIDVLNDDEENEMVRHEAAEALGGIAEEAVDDNPSELDAKDTGEGTGHVLSVLRRWAEDMEAPRVVRESCVVALDEIKCEYGMCAAHFFRDFPLTCPSRGRQQRSLSVPAHGVVVVVVVPAAGPLCPAFHFYVIHPCLYFRAGQGVVCPRWPLSLDPFQKGAVVASPDGQPVRRVLCNQWETGTHEMMDGAVVLVAVLVSSIVVRAPRSPVPFPGSFARHSAVDHDVEGPGSRCDLKCQHAGPPQHGRPAGRCCKTAAGPFTCIQNHHPALAPVWPAMRPRQHVPAGRGVTRHQLSAGPGPML